MSMALKLFFFYPINMNLLQITLHNVLSHSKLLQARQLNLTFNGDGHLWQFDQPFLPQFKSFLCSPVSISGTATKQLCGAVVEVGAERQTTAAQLTGFVHWKQQEEKLMIKSWQLLMDLEYKIPGSAPWTEQSRVSESYTVFLPKQTASILLLLWSTSESWQTNDRTPFPILW